MSSVPLSGLQGEIETPRPLRAVAGRISFTGWCLDRDGRIPDVRLVTSVGILPATRRFPRHDLVQQFTFLAADCPCGFEITGQLDEGVYLASFEAQHADGKWAIFRQYSLVVEPAPFIAAIETPTGMLAHERVHVTGWALHPKQVLKELVLRYGHQEISTHPGKNRPDLASLHPQVPHAAQASFESATILSAGRGLLRLKATLADGTVRLARTTLAVAVATDENIGPEIDLAELRVALPGYVRHADKNHRPQSDRPLNILFILPGSFASNSALHVTALANELSAAGHSCIVAVPHDLETLAHHELVRFRGITYAEAEAGMVFANGRGADRVHAWTTRENVRQLTDRVRTGGKLIVHLEDNEQEILALTLGRSVAELAALPAKEIDPLVPPDLSHPRHSREFLAAADGVTVITDKLRELVPAGKPCQTVTPAADERYFYPRPKPQEFRDALGLTAATTVLFYPGNVHASNATEMRELYEAVLLLNQNGHKTVLLRTGRDSIEFLGSLAAQVSTHVIELGQILHYRHLPPLMALADIFVQPGRADAFNDYRFPSKLTDFFAIGRPVILPRTNLGATLRHGIDAYVLDQADAASIAAAITHLRADPSLYDRLAKGAPDYATKHFSWRRSAEALAKFYQTLEASQSD